MGGFGSVSNMILNDMPAPPRLSTMEPMPSQYRPASRPESGGLGDAGADENDRNDGNVARDARLGSGYAGAGNRDGAKSPQSPLREGERSRPVSGRGDGDERSDGGLEGSARSRGEPRRTSSRPSTGARDAPAAAGSGGSRAGSLAGSRPTTGGTRAGSRPATGERTK
jgi:hypothetical protein